MPEITRELLRKKAEHNEGVLHTLEEVSRRIYREKYSNTAIAEVAVLNCS